MSEGTGTKITMTDVIFGANSTVVNGLRRTPIRGELLTCAIAIANMTIDARDPKVKSRATLEMDFQKRPSFSTRT